MRSFILSILALALHLSVVSATCPPGSWLEPVKVDHTVVCECVDAHGSKVRVFSLSFFQNHTHPAQYSSLSFQNARHGSNFRVTNLIARATVQHLRPSLNLRISLIRTPGLTHIPPSLRSIPLNSRSIPLSILSLPMIQDLRTITLSLLILPLHPSLNGLKAATILTGKATSTPNLPILMKVHQTITPSPVRPSLNGPKAATILTGKTMATIRSKSSPSFSNIPYFF
jgi:hypothetical protein